MTSGGKGRHVVVPPTSHDNWETDKECAKQVVPHIATVVPAVLYQNRTDDADAIGIIALRLSPHFQIIALPTIACALAASRRGKPLLLLPPSA